MSKAQINLNRSLRAEWLFEALRLASVNEDEATAREILTNLMSKSITGSESIRKSLRYLFAIWIHPQNDLHPLRNHGLQVYLGRNGKKYEASLSYFMLLATYPFVRQISEICGRLIRLQGTVKMEQIKRKAAEALGDTENTARSTRYTVSTLQSLGLLQSPSKGSYEAKVQGHSLPSTCASFCLDALLKSHGKERSLRRAELESHPALFAFNSRALIDEALKDARFIITRESVSEEVIGLRKMAST